MAKEELKYDQMIDNLAWVKVNNKDLYPKMLESHLKLIEIAGYDITKEQILTDIDNNTSKFEKKYNIDEILKEMEDKDSSLKELNKEE